MSTINEDGVEILKDLNKLLSVMLDNVLNSKTSDNKREGDVLAGVFPEEGVLATDGRACRA